MSDDDYREPDEPPLWFSIMLLTVFGALFGYVMACMIS